MDQDVLRGLGILACLALAPVLVTRLAACSIGWLRPRSWTRQRTPRRPGRPVATVRPLEVMAADLRRLYPGVHDPAPGTRMPKQRGVAQAYDERLSAAAGVLGVSTGLLELSLGGVDRELERLRVEHHLIDAGLCLVPLSRPGGSTGR